VALSEVAVPASQDTVGLDDDFFQGPPIGALAMLQRNLLIYGLGGVIIPFIGIKLIDLLITALNLV
jgi:hypothetical protein